MTSTLEWRFIKNINCVRRMDHKQKEATKIGCNNAHNTRLPSLLALF